MANLIISSTDRSFYRFEKSTVWFSFFCIETNNELESSIHEIEEKESMIEKLSTELEELKKQVQTKANEREKLLRKRKSLNEECNSLQKKLHYCDSLLKFVPKENSDS